MKKKNNLFDKISKNNNSEDAISEDTINILNLDETDLDDVEFVEEESEFTDAFDVEAKTINDLEDDSEELNSFDTKEIELISSNVVDEAIASMEDYSVKDTEEESVVESTDFIDGDQDGNVLYDENGFRIETDEDGNEFYYDEDGNRAVYDENGDYTLYNPDGYRIEYDEEGEMRLYDAKDREVVYNDQGEIVFASTIATTEDLEFTNLDDEDDYEEDSEEDDDEEEEKTGFIDKVKEFFSNLGPAEYGIGAGALLILVIGIIVIIATVNSTKRNAENMLANVGAQYASLKVSDVNTLQAIASKAYMSTAVEEVPEEEEDVECSEVKLTYTSIDKDLRIKFYNTANDKLVKGTEFEVKLTHKTDGDVYEFKDENADGIIYESDLKAGDYTVEVTDIDGITFIFETDYATVKGEIEYVVIDVADEVIENATGVEDTAVKDVEEETPTITDTVEWVESTRTSLDGTDGYKKIDKSEIKSPESSKIETNVSNIVLGDYNPYSICMASGYVKVMTIIRDPEDTPTDSSDIETTPTPESSPESSPEPSEEPETQPSEIPTVQPTESPSPEPTESPSLEPSASPSIEPTASPSTDVSPSPTADVIKLESVTIEPATVNVTVGKTVTLVATAKLSNGTIKSTDNQSTVKFSWSSDVKSTAYTVSGSEVTGKTAADKAQGNVVVTCIYENQTITAKAPVYVKKDYSSDTTSPLKTNDDKQVYVKDGNGYRTATFSDYYSATDFYIVYNTSYKYTGWQNIDGNTYFYDKDGNKVTGSQVISGVKYEFTSEGVLKTDTSGILGIDVSVWQGNINWTSVKNSGINFAIIRYGYRGSTQGGIYKDTKFDANISGAKAAGLKVGMYFFTQAITEAEAVEEASACIAAAKEYGISYPIFIDTESGGAGARAENLSVAQRTAVCKAFCQTVKNSGYSAGVYASKWWFGAKLNYSDLNGYVIWLAQYASAPSLNGRYDLWQYSSKGSVGGISGNVDMDISYMGY